MKICIPTSDDGGLQAHLNGHFGSAPFFTLVDMASGEIKALVNDNSHHQHGTCSPVGLLQSESFDAVVCQGMGRRALAALNRGGIDVHVVRAGRVSQAVEAVRKGESRKLTEIEACQGHGHGHAGGHHG